MVKKTIIGLIALSLSSLVSANIDNKDENSIINTIDNKNSLSKIEDFENWVSLVKKKNPELLCPITSQNNFICSYLDEITIDKDKNQLIYESNIKAYNNEYIAIPSFRTAIPETVLFNKTKIPFFIKKENGINVPYIKPPASQGEIKVLFNEIEPNLFFNNNVSKVTYNDIKYQANSNYFFLGDETSYKDDIVKKDIEYTIFNAVKYSQVPVFERHIVVQTNKNEGVFEIPIEMPKDFSIFKVSSSPYVPVVYENNLLKFDIKEENQSKIEFKIESKLDSSISYENIDFSIDELKNQFIAFKSNSLDRNERFLGRIKEDNRINQNRNYIKRMIPNIPNDIISDNDYIFYISSDDTIELNVLNIEDKNLPRNNINQPNLSSIETIYLMGNNGKTIVETEAYANKGAYRIILDENISNITAKLNGDFIPVSVEDDRYTIVLEKQGVLSVSAETFIDNNMFITSYKLPKSIIETDNVVDDVKVSGISLHTPLNKISGEQSLSYEIMIIIIFMSILFYMITKNVLISILYLIGSYMSLNSITITVLSFILISSILFSLIISGLYLIQRKNANKFIFIGKTTISGIISFGFLIGMVLNVNYLTSNKIIDITEQNKYNQRSSGIASLTMDSASPVQESVRSSSVSQKTISITEWKNPVGVSLNIPKENKIPIYKHKDVEENIVSRSFISAYWLAGLTWMMSFILIIVNFYRNSFQKIKNRGQK